MTDIVVLGGSAGAADAIVTICADLPAEFPVPVVLVMHVASGDQTLFDTLVARCALPVAHSRDGAVAGPGIWVAAPGLNVTVVNAGKAVQLRLGQGANPHLLQPSINPLFLSAAREFGSAVLGVLLSGFLDDGVEGLQAIKAAGGKVIVQSPLDAVVAEMPQAALRHLTADSILPAAAIGPSLTALMHAVVIGAEQGAPVGKRARA